MVLELVATVDVVVVTVGVESIVLPDTVPPVTGYVETTSHVKVPNLRSILFL